MKNNNSQIIRKITTRALKANTRRNYFIAIAIALTAFMITSVFSIGMGYYESMRLSGFRFEGIYSHAGMTGLTQEQLEKLEELPYVRHISQTGLAGLAELSGFGGPITMLYSDQVTWEHFQTPVFADIEGRHAMAENEVTMSRSKLTRMGITDPYVGMEIPISFALRDRDTPLQWRQYTPYEITTTHTKTFILSGIYTEFVSVFQAGTPIFMSYAFAQSHGLIIPEEANINIIFTNPLRAQEFIEQAITDLALGEGQSHMLHPALERGLGFSLVTMYVSMGLFIAFFMFTGFLLVYNVMYVSVSKDVRFYGMLKTMGTTPRQLRKIVNGQVLLLLAIGTPIGLAIAAGISFVLIPAFMGDFSTGAVISFSPWIYIGGAVFTLLTAYIGAFTSARKAARVSPVEAIKYAGEQRISSKSHIGKHGSSYQKKQLQAAQTNASNHTSHQKPRRGIPRRMAFRNAFRERKRAVIVLLSLFLGVTVFTSTVTITGSADVDSEIRHFYDFDFVVNAGRASMPQHLIDQIAAIDGVNEVHLMSSTFGQIEQVMGMGNVTGVDICWLLELDPDIGQRICLDAFERGEIVLIDAWWHIFLESSPNAVRFREHVELDELPVGKSVSLGISTLERRHTPHTTTVEIGGYLPRVRPIGGQSMAFFIGDDWRDIDIVMSNAYIKQHLGDLHVLNLGVTVQPGADTPVQAAIEAILPRYASITSTYEARRELLDGMFILLVMGVGLAAILGLIGVFNFINVIAVSLFVRKRELAALESVGMSRKQMRALLRWEGGFYWGIITIASIAAGPGVAYGLFYVFSNMAPAFFPHFVYPILPILLAYAIIVVICSITPELAYRSISKTSLVERLREGD